MGSSRNMNRTLKLPPKWFTAGDRHHMSDTIDSQLIFANWSATRAGLPVITAILGPNAEYRARYEWSSILYDDTPTLNLIELSYLLSEADEVAIKEKNCLRKLIILQQRKRGRRPNQPRSSTELIDNPLPYIIAIEKLASDFGRRVRVENIENEDLSHYLILGRGYSKQTDDPRSLIDRQ